MRSGVMPARFPGDRPGRDGTVVVATRGALARHGLDRLLHVLGQHGAVRLEQDPAVVCNLLEGGAVSLLLADSEVLASLPLQTLQSCGSRIALVAPADHLPADVPVPPALLCTMVSEWADEDAALASLARLLQCCHTPASGAGCRQCPLRTVLAPQWLPLSPREHQVFDCIGQGLGTTGIAGRTGLSVKTIEGYRERIKLKLGLEGREALRMAAARWRQGRHLPLPEPA